MTDSQRLAWDSESARIERLESQERARLQQRQIAEILSDTPMQAKLRRELANRFADAFAFSGDGYRKAFLKACCGAHYADGDRSI